MKHRDAEVRPISLTWVLRLLVCGFLTTLAIETTTAGPLSLEDCIGIALEKNPGLASARQDYESAKGSRLSTYNAFLPTATISGDLRQSRVGDAYTDLATGIPYQPFYESFSVSTSLRQNLVNLPAWFGHRAAGSDAEASRQTLRMTESELTYQVRQQYFLLLKAILLEKVATEALEVSEEQLRKSQALFELGSVARTDVLQARVNRAAAVQEEISSRNSIEQERARLAVLLGMEVNEPLEIQLEVENPPDMELNEARLTDEARSSLPEVKRAGAQVDASKQRNRSAFWSQFPTLSGSLYWNRQTNALKEIDVPINDSLSVSKTGGHRRGAAFSELVDMGDLESGASWGFSIGLTWQLFDGFNTIGSIRSARASLAASKEAYRQQKLQAALGVQEAIVSIKNAREGIRAAEESVELAEENLKLQQALYENGGGTILELNNAQVERTRSRNSLVEAQVGLQVAYAQLDRALGL